MWSLLGQTISDHNKRMITLTEFPIPTNKDLLNGKIRLITLSVITLSLLKTLTVKLDFLNPSHPENILNF
jgi:hypothetical protein